MNQSAASLPPFVMFGQNELFGDYVDLIHSIGGQLEKVVTNIPDPPGRAYPFAARLDDYNRFRAGLGLAPCVEEALGGFTPRPGERYLIGFRKVAALPAFIAQLRKDHALTFATLVHRTAYVSPMSTVSEGAYIGANATIAPGVTFAPFALVNRAASVGHDCRLGAYSTVAPGATLASGVDVGEKAFVAAGATIVPGIRLGEGAYVGAGAAVTRDVPAWTLVAGVPAVVKKELAPQ